MEWAKCTGRAIRGSAGIHELRPARPRNHEQTTGGTPYDFGYHYLPNNMDRITYPSGRQVSYTYTGAGRIATVSGAFSGNTKSYTGSILYTAHGAPQTLPLGNLVETTSYNGRLQPTQIQVGSLMTLTFGYGSTANNGNVQSQTVLRPGLNAT